MKYYYNYNLNNQWYISNLSNQTSAKIQYLNWND